jgi:hypothetical protein
VIHTGAPLGEGLPLIHVVPVQADDQSPLLVGQDPRHATIVLLVHHWMDSEHLLVPGNASVKVRHGQ